MRYSAKSELARNLVNSTYDIMKEHSHLFEFRRSDTPLLLVLDRRDDPITPLLNQVCNLSAFLKFSFRIKVSLFLIVYGYRVFLNTVMKSFFVTNLLPFLETIMAQFNVSVDLSSNGTRTTRNRKQQSRFK